MPALYKFQDYAQCRAAFGHAGSLRRGMLEGLRNKYNNYNFVNRNIEVILHVISG
jgi:hypothetical protein